MIAPVASAAPAAPDFLYPSAGAQDVNTANAFRWTAVDGADTYYLYVGTTQGANDLVNSFGTLALSYVVPSLPTGQTLWARIWARVNGSWYSRDITFQVSLSPPILTYPTAGQVNVDASKDFTWSAVAGAEGYQLFVGTAPGKGDVVKSAALSSTSQSYKFYAPFPANQTLYARLYIKRNGEWSAFTG